MGGGAGSLMSYALVDMHPDVEVITTNLYSHLWRRCDEFSCGGDCHRHTEEKQTLVDDLKRQWHTVRAEQGIDVEADFVRPASGRGVPQTGLDASTDNHQHADTPARARLIEKCLVSTFDAMPQRLKELPSEVATLNESTPQGGDVVNHWLRFGVGGSLGGPCEEYFNGTVMSGLRSIADSEERPINVIDWPDELGRKYVVLLGLRKISDEQTLVAKDRKGYPRVILAKFEFASVYIRPDNGTQSLGPQHRQTIQRADVDKSLRDGDVKVEQLMARGKSWQSKNLRIRVEKKGGAAAKGLTYGGYLSTALHYCGTETACVFPLNEVGAKGTLGENTVGVETWTRRGRRRVRR